MSRDALTERLREYYDQTPEYHRTAAELAGRPSAHDPNDQANAPAAVAP